MTSSSVMHLIESFVRRADGFCVSETPNLRSTMRIRLLRNQRFSMASSQPPLSPIARQYVGACGCRLNRHGGGFD